jgi:hypothetical protein
VRLDSFPAIAREVISMTAHDPRAFKSAITSEIIRPPGFRWLDDSDRAVILLDYDLDALPDLCQPR